MLQNAFAAGVQAALTKFAVAGQPSLSSVGMAPPVTRGLPPAAKPITANDLGITGNPNSAKMPMTPSQMLPSLSKGAPKLNPPAPKIAEEKQELCSSCRKTQHYGPCAREVGTTGEGTPLPDSSNAFIRTKMRGL